MMREGTCSREDRVEIEALMVSQDVVHYGLACFLNAGLVLASLVVLQGLEWVVQSVELFYLLIKGIFRRV